MKIIFLDIDGVLNSDMYEANRTDKLNDNSIDPSRVKLLSDLVKATDGEIRFGKDRDYYIETLYFPGTRAEWDSQIKPDDWRNRRCRKIVCTDEI